MVLCNFLIESSHDGFRRIPSQGGGGPQLRGLDRSDESGLNRPNLAKGSAAKPTMVLKWTLNLPWKLSANSLLLPFDSHSHQNPTEATEETMSNALQAYMLQLHLPAVIHS